MFVIEKTIYVLKDSTIIEIRVYCPPLYNQWPRRRGNILEIKLLVLGKLQMEKHILFSYLCVLFLSQIIVLTLRLYV
jgi:hypothetical protein